MNERIRQLAERAGFRSNPDIYDRNQSFDLEKFAELIVRECGQIAYSEENDYGNKIRFMILEHFGVE